MLSTVGSFLTFPVWLGGTAIGGGESEGMGKGGTVEGWGGRGQGGRQERKVKCDSSVHNRDQSFT